MKPQNISTILIATAMFIGSTSHSHAELQWHEDTFPPPNGGRLVYTIIKGNPACASYDAKNCLWGQSSSDIDFSKLKPLICGKMHRRLYGVYGYENSKHWCSIIDKKAGTLFDKG